MKVSGEASDFVSDLTPSAKRSLENSIKKQKKFMDGEITKKKLSKKDAVALNAIEESGASYENAGKDMNTWRNGGNGIDVIVIRDVTEKLIESGEFRMLSKNQHWSEDNDAAIADGIRLGTMLGKRLQVRNDEKSTKYNRLASGKIDKRLIAELGFGNDSVFYKVLIDRYSPAILHISIDASGSMGGDKWTNTMTSVVAIAKAASMISNLDVVISFRSTHETGRGYRSGVSYPLIALAYDSRKDKFSKIPRIFSSIHVNGTTPEGLAFEAIMKELVPGGIDKDSYFLNFSDGMPMFSNDKIYYTGDEAVKHTKKMTNKIRNMGVKVLSYYIGGEYERESNMIDFKTMYGKDACFINVTNVFEVAKTMNKLFLDK
jgi:nitric oxide reductase activation protein